MIIQLKKDIWTEAPKAWGSLPAVIVTDSLETLALCHDKLDWLHWPDNQAEWPFRYHSIIQSDIALLFAVCCVSSSSITSHQWMTYRVSPTLLSPTPKYAQVKGTPPSLVVASTPSTLKPSFWSHQGTCFTKGNLRAPSSSVSQGIISILDGSHYLRPSRCAPYL